MSQKYNVAIVGATGAVGETLISIIDQRNFPIENLYPLASKRSAGSKVSCQGKSWVVEDLDTFDFSKVFYKILFSVLHSRLQISHRKDIIYCNYLRCNCSSIRHQPKGRFYILN